MRLRDATVAVLVCIMLLLPPLTSIALAGPLADYGDAPDNEPAYDDPAVTGRFPSFYSTTNTSSPRRGPFAEIVDEVWLSETATSSTTTVEEDALTIDQDSDDASPLYGLDPETGQAVLRVRVATSSSATRDLWYFNAVMDLNRDGRWRRSGSLNEWIAVNIPVQLNPGKAVILVIPFQAPTSNGAWTRLAITDSQIDPNTFGPDGWDGSGPENGFTRGEIEDWGPTPYYWRPGQPPQPGEQPPGPKPGQDPLLPPPINPYFKDYDFEITGPTTGPDKISRLIHPCRYEWVKVTIINRGNRNITWDPGKPMEPYGPDTIPPGGPPNRPPENSGPRKWRPGDPTPPSGPYPPPANEPPPFPPGQVTIPPGGSFSFWFWFHESVRGTKPIPLYPWGPVVDPPGDPVVYYGGASWQPPELLPTGYNTYWLIITAISLMFAGGYLLFRQKKKLAISS